MKAVLPLSLIFVASSGAGGYESIVRTAAKAENISGDTLVAICTVESSMRPKAINKKEPKGKWSYGLCQLQEDTARDFGFQGEITQLLDPKINAAYAARVYAACVKTFRKTSYPRENAIACYNAGRRGAARCLARKGVVCNAEYVNKVKAVLDARRKNYPTAIAGRAN